MSRFGLHYFLELKVMDNSKRTFRLAVVDDLANINRIYNQAIAHRNQTADLEPLTIDETEQWFQQHQIEKYPVFVVEQAGRVVAWSSLSGYRTGRQALESVAEISYYVDQEHQGMGLGRLLMDQTMEQAEKYKFDTLVAILLDSNEPSKTILGKYGFKEWGRIPGAAKIDEQRVDHLYYGVTTVPVPFRAAT